MGIFEIAAFTLTLVLLAWMISEFIKVIRG